MATAVEGKSTEHVLKTLQDSDTERADLRAQKADLQAELDALRGANMEQQSKLMDLQATKLALADAEAKVTVQSITLCPLVTPFIFICAC